MSSPTPELVSRRFSLWARLAPQEVATFDAAGRLLTYRRERLFLRRGLDGSFLEMGRAGQGPWPWRNARIPEPPGLLERLGQALQARLDASLEDRTRVLLERAVGGLRDRYRTDSRAFAEAVGPVPIVPPNHARSLVVRLTEGCRHNACRFCSLYAGTRFRVRPQREFRQHVRRVLDYFAEGAGIRPSLWVGDASILEAGVEGAREALDVLGREVRLVDAAQEPQAHLLKGDDPLRFEGVYAFADVPRAARLEPAEVEGLRRGGIRRLYLGVESGSPGLLRGLGKPHGPGEVREAVRRLHGGGIGAGILLLVGAGGREHRVTHREHTEALVGDLDLGGEDFVFLSPLDGRTRGAGEPAAGAEPLTEQELAAEVRLLREACRKVTRGRQLRIADYQLMSFVY